MENYQEHADPHGFQFSILNSQFSIQLVGLHSSSPLLCWQRIVVDFPEDLERVIEDRTQIAQFHRLQ
jgi:hypothetical protein